ncbi:MAG: hypothetical protein R3F35_09490 [Myxococcota bacterium]
MMRGAHSTEQMIALHGLFAEGAACAETTLAEISGRESAVDVVDVRCTPLESFGERGLRLGDDLVAAVLGRLEGGCSGSIAVALEPEDALAWARTGSERDPLAAFVALGRALAGGLATALGEALRAKVALVDARLVERTEPLVLAATHAPSDTIVVSVRIQVEARDEAFLAIAHLLLEPKRMTQLLSSLAPAVH